LGVQAVSPIEIISFALVHAQSALEPRYGRPVPEHEVLAYQAIRDAQGALDMLADGRCEARDSACETRHRQLEAARDEAIRHANMAGELLAISHGEIALLQERIRLLTMDNGAADGAIREILENAAGEPHRGAH
jgi:hypothetical protein